MITFLDPLRDITFVTVIFRMLVAFACGMIVGLERSSKNRPAGFRTHILVCIAATSASLVGHYLYLGLELPADVSRIGAQVVTGLGFIGAGTIIITKKQTVKGLTTAAGLWATGIVGLAIGAGFYEGGILATVMILLVQTVVSDWGRGIKIAPEFVIELKYNQKSTLDHALRYSKDHNLAIRGLQIVRDPEDKELYVATVSVRPASTVEYEVLLEHLRSLKGVVEAKVMDRSPSVPESTH